MFVDQTDPAMTKAAIEAGMSAYVVDGLRPERLRPILTPQSRGFTWCKRCA